MCIRDSLSGVLLLHEAENVHFCVWIEHHRVLPDLLRGGQLAGLSVRTQNIQNPHLIFRGISGKAAGEYRKFRSGPFVFGGFASSKEIKPLV